MIDVFDILGWVVDLVTGWRFALCLVTGIAAAAAIVHFTEPDAMGMAAAAVLGSMAAGLWWEYRNRD
ncbi:MAG: hypothetical protein ACOY37_02020 [Pseudomonadota bacterium]